FSWCALFINMDNLSVSTDYTRYHDKCKSCLYVVERAINWRLDQSLWILLPLIEGAVLVLLLTQDVAVGFTLRNSTRSPLITTVIPGWEEPRAI
ncbi:hypothetical protein BJV77DRAFT_943265, partial [Russula vinacea]